MTDKPETTPQSDMPVPLDLDGIRRDREAGTPGPWAVNRYAEGSVETGKGRGICLTGAYQQNFDAEHIVTENRANARRIARVPDLEDLCLAQAEEIERLRARIAELEAGYIHTAASLFAAISLLERGGKAAKKAASSDKMFDHMLSDYRKTLGDARALLKGADE